MPNRHRLISWLMLINMGRSRGGRGSVHPLEYHKLLYVSLEILVRTPTSGPIGSRGRSGRPSVKYVLDKKESQDPTPSPWQNFMDPPMMKYSYYNQQTRAVLIWVLGCNLQNWTSSAVMYNGPDQPHPTFKPRANRRQLFIWQIFGCYGNKTERYGNPQVSKFSVCASLREFKGHDCFQICACIKALSV